MIYWRQIQAHPTSCSSQKQRRPIVIWVWAQRCAPTAACSVFWRSCCLERHGGFSRTFWWQSRAHYLEYSQAASSRFSTIICQILSSVNSLVSCEAVLDIGSWWCYFCPGVNNFEKGHARTRSKVLSLLWVHISLKSFFCSSSLFNELQTLLIHFLSLYYKLQVSKYFPLWILTVQYVVFPDH